MNIRKQLLFEAEKLEKLKIKTQSNLSNAPEGHLRLGRSNGCTQYYHSLDGKIENKVYIPVKNVELVKSLAQKAYDKKILQYVEKNLDRINRLLEIYQDDGLDKIYYSQHPDRQKLITTIMPTYEQQLKKWMATPHKGKGFMEGDRVELTSNNVKVRSKSERIIANYLESLDIPYKYECPLDLNGFGRVYPDFTFLSKKTGKFIYWEHEGMMGVPDYSKNAVKKINCYEKNGIYPGKNLILTFETEDSTIDQNIIKNIVERYLL